MQTFMTHERFAETAKSLDYKRLGKQRVEAYQILNSLTGKSNGWLNHPATKMWQGYEWQLANYGYEICNEWIERGFRDSLEIRFWTFMHENQESHLPKPWWCRDSLLHLTHQSNLVRKAPEYYQYGVPSNIPYVWPEPEMGSYRLGTFKNGDNLTMLKGNKVYLTSKQVAELLGLSPKTIGAYKARGQMPLPDKEYGRTPLWLYDTIEKWRGEIRTPVIPNKND